MPAPSAISTTVELYFWKSGLKDGLTCDLATKVKKIFRFLFQLFRGVCMWHR